MKSFKYWICLFVVVLSVLADDDEEVNLIVPLYVYPSWWESSFSWQAVADAAKKTTVIAIINQSNGPLPQPTTDFSKGMAALNSAGVYQFGFVNTSFAKKGLDLAKKEIDVWFSNNPQVTGIFFEQVNADRTVMNYYTELFNYVRNKRFSNKVILNVGSAAPVELYNSADIIVLFHGEEKNLRAVPISSAVKDIDSKKKAIFVMGCPSTRIAAVIQYAKSNNIGWVFVSNERVGFFSKLPSYFSSLIQNLNSEDDD